MKGLSKEELELIKKTDTVFTCNECKKELSVRHFTGKFSKINNKYYFNFVCNHCLYLRKLGMFREKLPKYKEKQKYRECFTIRGRANLLRNRCKQRAKSYNYEFNLSIMNIVEKLKIGVCEATGINFIFDDSNYNPYAPSIDRIDSSKGYTDDNIQITCLIYNFCKNQFSEEQVKDFFNKIKNK